MPGIARHESHTEARSYTEATELVEKREAREEEWDPVFAAFAASLSRFERIHMGIPTKYAPRTWLVEGAAGAPFHFRSRSRSRSRHPLPVTRHPTPDTRRPSFLIVSVASV